jgi:NAD dependent epimerase/dehydratase family enzyme
MADEMLLGGQRALPQQAQQEGFAWDAASLEVALARHL